jgi:Protein of unknown function (DUF2877)
MRKLLEHRASSIGAMARDSLAGGGDADVIAVFERSFYLLGPRGIVAVCMPELGRGPINVLVQANPGAAPWAGLIQVAMKAAFGPDRIVVHGGFVVAIADTTVWIPPPIPVWTTATLTRGLAYLHALAADHVPSDGLAAAVFAPTSDAARTPTATAAKALIADLAGDIPKAFATRVWSAPASRAATLLVGLGPGLTPSGDDFLGGLLLALTACHANDLRDALWESIVDELNDLTVPVSAMHLTAAAAGMGAEAMHAMLHAILTGDTAALPDRLNVVAQHGATSGWDALAGMVTGLSIRR